MPELDEVSYGTRLKAISKVLDQARDRLEILGDGDAWRDTVIEAHEEFLNLLVCARNLVGSPPPRSEGVYMPADLLQGKGRGDFLLVDGVIFAKDGRTILGTYTSLVEEIKPRLSRGDK